MWPTQHLFLPFYIKLDKVPSAVDKAVEKEEEEEEEVEEVEEKEPVANGENQQQQQQQQGLKQKSPAEMMSGKSVPLPYKGNQPESPPENLQRIFKNLEN